MSILRKELIKDYVIQLSDYKDCHNKTGYAVTIFQDGKYSGGISVMEADKANKYFDKYSTIIKSRSDTDEIKINTGTNTNHSVAKQPTMTYEKAYKRVYECFLGWLEKFNEMKPDEYFNADRIDGAITSIASMLAEMEDCQPEIRVIREERDTWKKDLKEAHK